MGEGFLGTVTIEMTSKGEEYSLAEAMGAEGALGDEASNNAQEMLRNILLAAFTDDLKYRQKTVSIKFG